MSSDLLTYYQRELDSLRGLAGEFAEAYPKIAGRLRLGADAVDDPHVGRLLEGVAFLSARVQSRLDDEFPEISDALLGVLYPHYLAPVPSMAIVQFQLDPARAQLPKGFLIDRLSRLRTQRIGDLPCKFRTGYPVTLWPVQV